MNADVLANLRKVAGQVNNYFVWLKDYPEELRTFVSMLDGNTTSCLIASISGGNGLIQQTPAYPTPSINSPDAEVIYHDDDEESSQVNVQYQGNNRVLGVDGKNHLIFTNGNELPRFCLESGRGPTQGQWVALSEDRKHGLLIGSLVMSEKGYVIPNPDWRNWGGSRERVETPAPAKPTIQQLLAQLQK